MLIIYSKMATKNTCYDKKVFRLFFILNQLDSRRKVSMQELAREFNVSPALFKGISYSLTRQGCNYIIGERIPFLYGRVFTEENDAYKGRSVSSLFSPRYFKITGRKFEDSFSSILKRLFQKNRILPFM